jgi:hypothetical protein
LKLLEGALNNINYIKKSATPAMAVNAPSISLGVIFSLNIIIEKGIIRTGTILIMVAAMPDEVYFTARSENETPRKGPKMRQL